MVKIDKFNTNQRRTLAGYIDAASPNCAGRIHYYELSKTMGLDGAISYLRSLGNANHSMIDLAEKFIKEHND
jgi:hypothetical protein